MTTASRFIGCFAMCRNDRCNSTIRRSSAIRWVLAAAAVAATPAWSADTVTDAATERTNLEAQYAYRVEIDSDPELDPVVFTEIVPFTADENAVRLPPDQDLD
jgi:hypothetical protein